jgi:hypothetical protein
MSLYPTKSLIQSNKLQTIDELIAELQKFKTSGANYIDVSLWWDDTLTTADDVLVSLELLEKTLSDGSVMYDIKMNFSENV